MGSWRDVAAAARREPRRAFPVETFGLPHDLAAALRNLDTLTAPRKLEHSGNWQGVVADAMILARDGWAAKAIALGWSVGDLFGIGQRDDRDYQGLAVWLSGRRIVVLDAARAIAADTHGGRRDVFQRSGMRHGTHPTVVPVMLWDFGR